MNLQESIEKRLKQRQEELKSQKEMLEYLLANQSKTAQKIKNAQDMIHLITGAIFELAETEKEMNAEKVEVQS